MCINTLPGCSYPHHEPVTSILFDPAKKEGWQICDRNQPWGQLSCGHLEIHHSIMYHRSTISTDTLIDHATQPDLIPRPAGGPTSNIDPNHAPRGYAESALCEWCTAVLSMHAHKFKTVQDEAQKVLDKLEEAMDANEDLRDMDKNVKEMEDSLKTLQADAWLARKKIMMKANTEAK